MSDQPARLPTEATEPGRVRAELVMIGSELLLGEIVDTNAAYLARELALIGCDLYFKTTVGDNPARMEEAFRLALGRAGLVISSGGLGPTEDDLTREVAARVTGLELVFHQRLMDQIEERMRRRGFAVSPNNRKQAVLPAGAIAIENRRGTAPGFILEGELGTIIAMPGVPSELQGMMEAAVLPYLKRRYGIAATIVSRTLKVSGMTESGVDQVVGDLIRESANPTVGIYASPGLIRLRVTAKAAAPATTPARERPTWRVNSQPRKKSNARAPPRVTSTVRRMRVTGAKAADWGTRTSTVHPRPPATRAEAASWAWPPEA